MSRSSSGMSLSSSLLASLNRVGLGGVASSKDCDVGVYVSGYNEEEEDKEQDIVGDEVMEMSLQQKFNQLHYQDPKQPYPKKSQSLYLFFK